MKNLEWLVWMCNFAGVLPFRMIWSRNKRLFLGFGFSWKYLESFWFLLILLCQITFFILVYIVAQRMEKEDYHSFEGLPMVYTVATHMFKISSIIEYFSPYLIFFHLSKLKTVANGFQHVDKVLDKTPLSRNKIKLRIRISIVFFILLVWFDTNNLYTINN